jgi:Ca2+-binding RTX toxin-like protein
VCCGCKICDDDLSARPHAAFDGGFDSFNFTNGLSAFNIDLITDFNHAADTIRLENAIFTGLAIGRLSAAAFRVGATAADATDRIIPHPIRRKTD